MGYSAATGSAAALPPLLGMGERRLAHPGAVRVRIAPLLHALPVARAVAGDHALELGPVDLAEFPVPGRLVELQRRIRESSVRGDAPAGR